MVKARIPELEDCGCGVPLALGAKVISISFIVISCGLFLGSLFVILNAELDYRDPEPNEPKQRDEKYLEVIAVMVMIVSGVHGTLAFLLFYGVKEHKPSFVLPWAILTAAFTIVFTFISFLVLLHKFSYEQVVCWIGVVVLYYCVLIVYSHFRELVREQNLPQTLTSIEDP